MRFPFLLLLLLTLVVSCTREPEQNFDFLADKDLSISTKIERYLGSDSLLRTRFSEEEITLLRAYYEQVNYEPTVASTDSTLLKNGKILTALINESLAFGVPQELCIPLNDSLHSVEI